MCRQLSERQSPVGTLLIQPLHLLCEIVNE